MKSSITKLVTTGLCTFALAFGTFSCQSDLLDPVPTTLFPQEVVFDTPARVLLQVNNLYASVKVGNFLGGRYQVYSDVRANDFLNMRNNGVTALGVWNHTLTEQSQNDVVNLWAAGYLAINQINVFLAGMEANAGKFTATPFPTTPVNFATVTAVNYQAEARFLRALSYYSLLQLYARPYIDGNGSKPGLPLRLKAEVDGTNNDLARSTVAEVYTQILADLDYAEQNLPLLPTNYSPVIRAHRNTAIALKTRVYLTMGRYDDVIQEANKIVPAAAPFVAPTGSVRNGLNASIVDVFAAPQETTESILSFPFTAQNAPGTQNQLAFYYLPVRPNGDTRPSGNGEYALNSAAGSILANPGFLATDQRRTSLITTQGSTSYLNKYTSASPYLDKAPVIRYAEVMLSLAEARFRKNPADTQALALLNAVRVRSTSTAAAYAAFGSVAEAVDAVLLERRIEFLGEGIRNIDIMRLNTPIPAKGTVSEVKPTDILYVWPIPASELATNKLMTRN